MRATARRRSPTRRANKQAAEAGGAPQDAREPSSMPSSPRPKRPSPLPSRPRWRNVRGIADDAARAIVERLIGAAPDEKTVAAAVADVLQALRIAMLMEAGILGRRRLRPLRRRCWAISACTDDDEALDDRAARIKAELDEARQLKDEAAAAAGRIPAQAAGRRSARRRTSSPAPRPRPSASPPRPRPRWRTSSRGAPRWPKPRSHRPKRRRSPTSAARPPTPPSPPPRRFSAPRRQGQGRRRSDRQGHRRRPQEAELAAHFPVGKRVNRLMRPQHTVIPAIQH